MLQVKISLSPNSVHVWNTGDTVQLVQCWACACADKSYRVVVKKKVLAFSSEVLHIGTLKKSVFYINNITSDEQHDMQCKKINKISTLHDSLAFLRDFISISRCCAGIFACFSLQCCFCSLGFVGIHWRTALSRFHISFSVKVESDLWSVSTRSLGGVQDLWLHKSTNYSLYLVVCSYANEQT